MSKVIDRGLAPPDSPIFSNGILIGPVSKRSIGTSQPATDGTSPQPHRSLPTGQLSPEDQKEWDEVQKQLDQEHREGMKRPSSTGVGPKGSPEEQAERDALVAELFEGFASGATSTEEAEEQVKTREQQVREAREKMIADNVKLGGRPDDHPLIMKWRTELGPPLPGTKYLTGASLAAVIAAVILAFFGLWVPAGIVAVGSMILFAVPIVWQSFEHRSAEETGNGEVSKDQERIHHLLAGERMSDQVYKVPPYSKEEFGEIKLIPYEPPEPDPPTSLTPLAEQNFLRMIRAYREGGRAALDEELKRQGHS